MKIKDNKNYLSDLIRQIHSVNYGWKLAQEMENNEHFLAIRLREFKTRLQIKLLKKYAPDYVYLKIDSMLQNTRETVQIELERFRLEYQVSLTDFFDKQNQLLDETLGRQKEGLAEVVNNLQTTFKEESETRKQLTGEVNQSLTNIKETTRIVSNLVNATGMNSSERYAQLQELAETLGNEAEKVETAYQQMTNQFREISQIITHEFKNILGEITQEFDLLSTKINKNTK